jgi:hypothetical protein
MVVEHLIAMELPGKPINEICNEYSTTFFLPSYQHGFSWYPEIDGSESYLTSGFKHTGMT